jgi:hypothetical protein
MTYLVNYNRAPPNSYSLFMALLTSIKFFCSGCSTPDKVIGNVFDMEQNIIEINIHLAKCEY